MSQIPVSRGIRVCEKIIIEEGTRNYSLLNCFNHRSLPRVPSEPLDFFIHVALADGLGDMNMEVFITKLAEDDRLYHREAKMTLTDRLQEFRLTIHVRDLVFPAAGWYQVGLLFDGELVDQTVLTIYLKGTQP